MAQPPVKIAGWLAFNENGTGKWTTRQPALDRNWRAIQITLEVSRELFCQPTLRATIKVPDEQSIAPTFDLVAETAAETLKTALGVDIDVRMVSPEPQDT